MTRWIKHWQTLPRYNRVGAALCLAALIALLVTLVFQVRALVAGRAESGAVIASPAASAALTKE